jgi:hypothetical protein
MLPSSTPVPRIKDQRTGCRKPRESYTNDRFHGIDVLALIWKYRSRGRWRGGRPRIALETRQLIREMARANFLWGAPRIHGELLKLGITVSQATVSRYMPPSPKDRRSQAWRTFIRNHAIGVTQSHSFNAHDCTRDHLSQIWSRSRVFTYRLSAFVVASVTGPSCLVWRTAHPLLVAVARPRVWFTRIVTLTNNSMVPACRYRPATRKAGPLTIDRIRGPPTTQERHAGRSSRRSTGKRASSTRLTRRYTTASSTNCPYSQTAIATHRIATAGQPPHLTFGTTFSRALMHAAHLLRNYSHLVIRRRRGLRGRSSSSPAIKDEAIGKWMHQLLLPSLP